ncbi:hypothetical protein OKW32_006666 [Paraburkholderia youngii]
MGDARWRSLDDLMGFEWGPTDGPVAAFRVVLACALGLKDSSIGKGVFEARPVPLARSASGLSQETVLVHSPLQQVSPLSNSTLRSSGISARCGKG